MEKPTIMMQLSDEEKEELLGEKPPEFVAIGCSKRVSVDHWYGYILAMGSIEDCKDTMGVYKIPKSIESSKIEIWESKFLIERLREEENAFD